MSVCTFTIFASAVGASAFESGTTVLLLAALVAAAVVAAAVVLAVEVDIFFVVEAARAKQQNNNLRAEADDLVDRTFKFGAARANTCSVACSEQCTVHLLSHLERLLVARK